MTNSIQKEVIPPITEVIKETILTERDKGFSIECVNVQIECKGNVYQCDKTISLKFRN